MKNDPSFSYEETVQVRLSRFLDRLVKFYELAAPAFFSLLVAICFLFCPVTPVWALSLAFFTHLTSAQCAICLSSVCVQQF